MRIVLCIKKFLKKIYKNKFIKLILNIQKFLKNFQILIGVWRYYFKKHYIIVINQLNAIFLVISL